MSAVSTALCTVADRGYVPFLLTLRRSLRRFHPASQLHVLCLDDDARGVLDGLEGVTAVPVERLEREDPALRHARSDRSVKEYAWTLKPAFCLYCLDHVPGADAVVFLDADQMLFAPLDPLLDPLGSRSIVLVPERHVSPAAWSTAGVRTIRAETGEVAGHYNSGAVGFRADRTGRAALAWWRERCLEHCRAGSGAEDRGDQWHLNQVPGRFGSVAVISHPGVGLAPWNARGSRIEAARDGVLVDGSPVVLYHFQSLRLRRSSIAARSVAWCGNHVGPVAGVRPALRLAFARERRLPRAEVDVLWQAYRRELSVVLRELNAREPNWAAAAGADPISDLMADAAWDLRWRGYRLLGRILPRPLRVGVSVARVRIASHRRG